MIPNPPDISKPPDTFLAADWAGVHYFLPNEYKYSHIDFIPNPVKAQAHQAWLDWQAERIAKEPHDKLP